MQVMLKRILLATALALLPIVALANGKHGAMRYNSTVIEPLAGAWMAEGEIGAVRVKALIGDTEGGGPRAKHQARIRLTFTDANGKPATAKPLAWMLAARNTQAALETPCRAKVKTAASGGLTMQPAVDFNEYRLIVIDDQSATLGVINPAASFSGTSLETVIPLPGIVGQHARGDDPSRLFVTLPATSAVAVVDLAARKVAALISVPPGSRPSEIAVSRDGSRIFVALEALGGVAVINTERGDIIRMLKAGSGPVHLQAFEGGIAFVNERRKTLTIHQLANNKIDSISLDFEPSLITANSRSLFAGGHGAGHVARFDLATAKENGRLSVPLGSSALAMDPEGRNLVVLNRDAGTLSVIDPETLLVQTQGHVVDRPVEMGFSRDFLYVRGADTATFGVVTRSSLQKGELSAAVITTDRSPDEQLDMPRQLIAFPPEGQGALIGNPASGLAAYYMEGMNVASGTIKLYAQRPKSLLTLDNSLQEVAPGVFEAVATMPSQGEHELAIVLNQTNGEACLPLSVASNPASAKSDEQKTNVEMICQSKVAHGVPSSVTVVLRDSKTGLPVEGLQDVTVLASAPPSNWQQRRVALEIEPGVYRAELMFRRSGKFFVSVASRRQGVGVASARPMVVEVE